mmetsp:Transcript_4566/g.9893  ORF Transcript_4566/g.9893 Transcript_4566/m.9893 type:complete len:219 (+) Transcript_4566:691-1347(+)
MGTRRGSRRGSRSRTRGQPQQRRKRKARRALKRRRRRTRRRGRTWLQQRQLTLATPVLRSRVVRMMMVVRRKRTRETRRGRSKGRSRARATLMTPERTQSVSRWRDVRKALQAKLLALPQRSSWPLLPMLQTKETTVSGRVQQGLTKLRARRRLLRRRRRRLPPSRSSGRRSSSRSSCLWAVACDSKSSAPTQLMRHRRTRRTRGDHGESWRWILIMR